MIYDHIIQRQPHNVPICKLKTCNILYVKNVTLLGQHYWDIYIMSRVVQARKLNLERGSFSSLHNPNYEAKYFQFNYMI